MFEKKSLRDKYEFIEGLIMRVIKGVNMRKMLFSHLVFLTP